MQLGLITDIHECYAELRQAIDWMHLQGVDQFVFLGDLVAAGDELDPCVALLKEVGATGVWGNHDYEYVFPRQDQPSGLRDFFQSLQPRLELGDVLVSHVFPQFDPHQESQLWYLRRFPEAIEDAAESFGVCTQRVMLSGHLHDWRAVKDGKLLDWSGESALQLQAGSRYLIVVGAICTRRCGILDTDRWSLTPYHW